MQCKGRSFLLCRKYRTVIFPAKAPYEAAHRGERHMRTEFSDFVMRAFVLAYPKTSGSMQE